MSSSLFSKVRKRYSDSRSQVSTAAIIDDIFDLSDKNIKNLSKINLYMHELKSRGSDAVFEYYVKYVKRVLEEEVELKHINVYYALNEVLKLNEAEKIWKFVNILQDLEAETSYILNYDKCSKAMAETGNVTFNLYWAETYPKHNQANINVILNSKDIMSVARMVSLVSNLTSSEIAECVKIVKASNNIEAKKELKQALKDREIAL